MKKLSLKELRESLGLTQEDISDLMKLPQEDILRIESRSNLKIATIKKYVEACGSELEINAITENGRVRINA